MFDVIKLGKIELQKDQCRWYVVSDGGCKAE